LPSTQLKFILIFRINYTVWKGSAIEVSTQRRGKYCIMLMGL